MRIFLTTAILLFICFSAFAYDKACPTCDFYVIEKAQNKDNCTEYIKYFFENKRIGKSYEELGAYFVPNHKYAEYWKRFLPESNEKYTVDKKYVNNSYVMLFYEIIPKKIHIKEGKKANLEMIVDKERYYFQMQEVDNGTEITSCYSILK